MTGAHRLPPNRSIPDVTVIPELAYADLDRAVSWLCSAFGFGDVDPATWGGTLSKTR